MLTLFHSILQPVLHSIEANSDGAMVAKSWFPALCLIVDLRLREVAMAYYRFDLLVLSIVDLKAWTRHCIGWSLLQ